MRENKVYEQYVAEIFQYFKGCEIGQGCFFFRQLNAKNRQDIEKVRILTKVMLNLFSQNYFYSEDGGNFFKLTEKGYAYTQDGRLDEISVNLKELINFLDKNAPSFQTLWSFIGKDGEAPFYVTGPEYFGVAKQFVRIESVTYNDYMSELQNNGQSTSRSTWYHNLYKEVKPDEVGMFLDSLSVVIFNAYNSVQPQSISANSDLEDDPFSNTGVHVTQMAAPVQNQVPTKTVFVSYSHDNPQHEEWVQHFAEEIRRKGIRVITDKDIRFGQDVNHFMEESIAISDRILIIISEKYKLKADGRMAGVGYETGIITGELVDNQNSIKFIPIIREGSGKEFYPRYLGNRWGADFTSDANFSNMIDKLAGDILS